MLSLEVATPENVSSHSTLSSICQKVCTRFRNSSLTSGPWQDAAYPSCDSPNTIRRSALGANNVGRSKLNVLLPGTVGMRGFVYDVWSYDYVRRCRTTGTHPRALPPRFFACGTTASIHTHTNTPQCGKRRTKKDTYIFSIYMNSYLFTIDKYTYLYVLINSDEKGTR